MLPLESVLHKRCDSVALQKQPYRIVQYFGALGGHLMRRRILDNDEPRSSPCIVAVRLGLNYLKPHLSFCRLCRKTRPSCSRTSSMEKPNQQLERARLETST